MKLIIVYYCLAPSVSRPGQRPGHLLFHQVIWPGMTWCSAATVKSTVSNAELRSRSARNDTWPMSAAAYTSDSTFKIAVSVEWHFLYADWTSGNKLFSPRNSCSCHSHIVPATWICMSSWIWDGNWPPCADQDLSFWELVLQQRVSEMLERSHAEERNCT